MGRTIQGHKNHKVRLLRPLTPRWVSCNERLERHSSEEILPLRSNTSKIKTILLNYVASSPKLSSQVSQKYFLFSCIIKWLITVHFHKMNFYASLNLMLLVTFPTILFAHWHSS